MRIAVDIDEVLADGLNSYLKYFNTTYQTNFTKANFSKETSFWDTLHVAPDDVEATKAHYDASPLSRDWGLIPGAQAGIKTLARDHDLFIISNRMQPRHEPTKSWLDKHFSSAFQDIYFTESERVGEEKPAKAMICQRHNLKLLLEDEPKEAIACSEVGIKVILFDTYMNKDLDLPGVYRVLSWDEALAQIAKLTTR